MQKYIITNCTLPPTTHARFAEMGLVTGATVSLIKTAPLGDPVEIEILGYRLCIRKSEAAHFFIREAGEK